MLKHPIASFVAVSPNEKFVYAVHEDAPQNGKGGEIAAFSFNKETEYCLSLTNNHPAATIPAMWKLIKQVNGFLHPITAVEVYQCIL